MAFCCGKSSLGKNSHLTVLLMQTLSFDKVLVRKGLNAKQHLTVNVWGEMKCEAAEALYEVLAPFSITVFTLKVRGNLTSEVSNSIARCLEENKTHAGYYLPCPSIYGAS